MPRTFFDTALGPCGIAWGENGLTDFFLLETGRSEKNLPKGISQIVTQIQKTIASKQLHFRDIPLDWSRVTPFQKQVYKAACTVPSGTVLTYGELAALTGRKRGAARAIGGALGKNPWPLLVPCHRFIGASGNLTGYSASGGITTKRRILEWEGWRDSKTETRGEEE